MNDNRWVKLHSKLLNWEWYRDTNTKVLFLHCLLKANWKDGNFEGKIIPRGSFVTSVAKLSQELSSNKHKFTIQQVRTSIEHLKSTNEITITTTNKYTIITVNNYELYQGANKPVNNQLTNKQQTTNKQVTTIVEYKNNRIKEYKNRGSIYTPPTLDEIKLFCSENEYQLDCEKFYSHYESVDWKNNNGNYITNWKAKVKYWVQQDKTRHQEKQTYQSKRIAEQNKAREEFLKGEKND